MKALVASLALLIAAPAAAQQQCPIYQDLKKFALENGGMVPSGSGVTSQGKAAVIVFASPEGETWMMAIINQEGRACVVASGDQWITVIPPHAPVPGERPS